MGCAADDVDALFAVQISWRTTWKSEGTGRSLRRRNATRNAALDLAHGETHTRVAVQRREQFHKPESAPLGTSRVPCVLTGATSVLRAIGWRHSSPAPCCRRPTENAAFARQSSLEATESREKRETRNELRLTFTSCGANCACGRASVPSFRLPTLLPDVCQCSLE